MHNYLRTTRKLLATGLLFLLTTTLWAQSHKDGVRKGMVKVKFTATMTTSLNQMRVHSGKELTTGMQAFDAVAKTTTAKNMYRLFPYDPQHESKLRKHGLHLWYVVELDPATNPKQAAAIYKKVKGVAVAEADHEKVLSPFQVSEYKGGISPMSATPFNDPYLPSQWHYENTGQTGYPNGADVNLYEAWKITAGSRDVIVSIHDQGVDVAHNDLAANMWVNTAEKNGTPDVDDDGNGYVDDIHGWNFDNNNGKIDAQFHGTHVAGTVGAVNNNGIGVSGVAGGTGANDGVRIMSLQILGGGSAENSYIYAANNGAVISQNSWGYINPGSYDQSVLDAIDYFIAEAGNYAGSPMKGGVVIFASGNNNMDAPFYPAYHPGVIAVNSIGPDYKKASYSNYGAWTEISAPGGEVSLGSQNGVLSTLPNNKVGYLQGTSMACPHVSGIAALALAARTHQFTAAELTNKLLTGVVDIDSSNPDYIGKLGSGLIDAKFAIQHDQHKAPEVISDLQITAMTQEFATLRWTVPADEDDNKPVSFTLYYHTSPLTPENLIDAEKINLANKLTAGETANAEVNGLLGLTTYYFGVVSQDRWGNLSMLSNIAQGTTNEGPQIDVDEDSKSINLSIDASGATEAEHSITILNQAEGLLRWSSLTRNKDHELSWSSAGLQYPVLKKAKIASAGVLSRKLSSASSQQRTDIAPASFETIEKGYGWGWPIVMVGETDTTLSNSSATRFEVTEDEGFNLTHVKMWLRHNTENGPIILEVYEGEVVQKKNLVFAQEFTAPTNFEDNYSIRLDEQLFFEKGKVFWIAFHVPSGTIYPLGIAEALDNDFSKNCLMSFDLGKTWTSLPDLLHDNRYVWSTRAASYNKHLGNYLTLEPSSGEVNGNESGSTVLTANASALINGTYKANVIVQSNDADTPELRLPVELTVSGHQPDIRSTDIVNFGSVFRGTTKDVTITVRNEGYGNFNSPNVTISDPRFEIVGYAPWRIAAREEEEIIIRFKPTGAGNVNAMLVLESGAITHTVALFGVGTEPSEIKITPATQTFNNLALGDEVDATVTIENTGEYALKYFIPGYDTKGISNNWPEPYHRYGYTFHTSLPSDPAPATYEWNDISTTGTDITTFFKNVSNDYYAIDLDFDFPYYTHVMEKVYVTPMGLLTFDNSVRLVNAPRLKDSYGPIALVSATGGFYKYLTDGKVFYKKESDRLIVQYDHVKEDSWMGHYTFQIVLFDNGNIRFYYNDISTNDPWILNYMTALIEDPEKEDGILASNVMNSLPWQDAMALAFDYPGPQVIADIVNGAGIVMPGQSAEVAIRMNTAGLVEGLTSKNIGIISNDPFNPVSTANIKLNVTSGGIADPVISTTAIDFGRVFQQASKSEIFVIKNDGSSSLNVTGVIMQNGKFNLTGNSPATITPKHAEKYVVTMPTATLGVLNDKVVITFSDGSTHEIVVTGEVVEAPGIDVDLSPIDAALDHGTTDTYPFTIRNDGQAELEVSVTGSEWATTNIAEASIGGSSIPEFTYAWRSSADSDGPVYQWIDIVGKGVKIPAEEMDPFDDEKYWKKVNLPWSFNFFGETYDSLYIGFNGVISFNAGQPATFWSANIPSAEAPNNFIAPWWGSAGYDSYYNPETSGIFYKIEDDKIIISFERLINVFSMGDPMSVQAILYKNGTIKFQYKAQGGLELNSNLGVVGVENKSGTDGVEIAAYQLLPMANGLAYVLSPAKKRYLNPGEQLDGTITLDASNLYAGDYTTALHINSNVPNKETLNKPIHLTVNGSAELATTSEINFGEVMSYEMDYGWYTGPASYTREFALTNEGSAALTVQSMAAENENPELTIQVLVSGFWGPEWINVMDWLWQSQSINPGESVKARVVYSPASAQELANNIVITTDTENVSIPVTATAVLPPAIDADKTPVKVSFNSASETTARTINFNNDNGASALKYELSIDYKRKGATVAQEAQQVTSSTVRLPEQQVSTQKTNSGSIMPLSFNRTLTYEEADAANTFLGFNGTADFTSAVRFNAGSEGFNLTHIQTYFRSESLSAGTLEIEIRAGGTNVATAVSLMTMTKDFTATTPDAVGKWNTIALDQAQKILPHEDFYVIITYPMSINFPQGTVYEAEQAPGRYMFYSEGLWYDLQEYDQFKDFGWMMRAAEATAEATAWVSIDGATSGTVNAGEGSTIGLKFAASPAQPGDQHANLIIRSNDPYNSLITIPMSLHLNEAPVFSGMPAGEKIVLETEQMNFTLQVKDPELNSFTVSTIQNYDRLTYTLTGNALSINYAPDYTDAGSKEFVFEAKDQHNAVRRISLFVNVENRNRAPLATNASRTLEYFGKGFSDEHTLAEYFTDPDGDALTFTIVNGAPAVADVFTSTSKFMIKTLTIGETSVIFKVQDGQGGEIIDTVKVIVHNVLGVNEDLHAGIKVYPNPVGEMTTIQLSPEWKGQITFEICDITGKVQAIKQTMSTQATQIDVSDLRRGLYVLRVSSQHKTATIKLIKE